jgi:hypothetical protein
VRLWPVFSLVRALPSTTSAEACASLFSGFIGVGSEEAHLRAGLRPPLSRVEDWRHAP